MQPLICHENPLCSSSNPIEIRIDFFIAFCRATVWVVNLIRAIRGSRLQLSLVPPLHHAIKIVVKYLKIIMAHDVGRGAKKLVLLDPTDVVPAKGVENIWQGAVRLDFTCALGRRGG